MGVAELCAGGHAHTPAVHRGDADRHTHVCGPGSASWEGRAMRAPRPGVPGRGHSRSPGQRGSFCPTVHCARVHYTPVGVRCSLPPGQVPGKAAAPDLQPAVGRGPISAARTGVRLWNPPPPPSTFKGQLLLPQRGQSGILGNPCAPTRGLEVTPESPQPTHTHTAPSPPPSVHRGSAATVPALAPRFGHTSPLDGSPGPGHPA